MNQYVPDCISPPGETLLEVLVIRGIRQIELAECIGKPPAMINEIIQGIAPITPEIAFQLERVLNIPARFWNSRERRYQRFLNDKKEKTP